MRRLTAVLVGLALVAVVVRRPSGEPQKPALGSCVECHRKSQGVAYLQHNLEDWEGSRHAALGVTCQACHGGDPAAAEKGKAHRGMLPSTDVHSRVYYTAIPATCGACHEREYRAFQKSAHYRELQNSGKGPNCVTCHGSMANVVLSPSDLERTCTICHRRPTLAYATLLSLNNAGRALKRLTEELATARAKGVDAAQQEQERREAATLHGRALEDWHTFKMSNVLTESQDVTKRAIDASNELGLKLPDGSQPH